MRQEFETEILTAKESVALVKRRPSYGKMVVGLYLLSFYGLERSRVMRASYLPVRLIDDLVDGDARGTGEPLSYATELREHIRTNDLTGTPIERQLHYALEVLESKAKPRDNPRADFIKSLDSIIFDKARSSERRILSAYEIEQYYRDAFDPVINITLMAIDSHLRSNDIPALSYGQGRVYSARDFKEDWRRGIINVPGDVVSSAGLSNNSSPEMAAQNVKIIDWFNQNLTLTKPDLVNAQAFIQQSHEKQTMAVGNSLISPMLKFIETSQRTSTV